MFRPAALTFEVGRSQSQLEYILVEQNLFHHVICMGYACGRCMRSQARLAGLAEVKKGLVLIGDTSAVPLTISHSGTGMDQRISPGATFSCTFGAYWRGRPKTPTPTTLSIP